MEIRRFDFDKDYPTVYQWWLDWGWQPIDPDMLPDIGLIVSNDGEDVCCVFIYKTDSFMCVIDWWISNKKASKQVRKGCIEYLIEGSIRKARDLGFKAVFTSIRNSNLIKKLEDFGYKEKDLQMTNFIMRL